MKLFLTAVTTLLLTVQAFSNETLPSSCKINMELSKSSSLLYDYTGYGELICDQDKPITIFSAVNLTDKARSKVNKFNSFKFSTDSFEVYTMAYLFQTYKLTYTLNPKKPGPVLMFSGNQHAQARNIKTFVTSPAISTDLDYFNLMDIIINSSIIIEQDDFFSQDEVQL